MTTLGQHDQIDRPPATPHGPRAAGETWPVPPSALAALTDMGMSDEAIGRYFGVDTAAVRSALDKTTA